MASPGELPHLGTPRGRAATRNVRLALVAVGRAALAAAVALAGAIGTAVAVATASTSPALFLTAGLGCAVALAAATLWLLLRHHPRGRRRRATVAGSAVVGAVVAVALLTPLSDPRAPEPVPPGTQRWQLATGSGLAYVHLPAVGLRRPTPVVVLHGGPGIPDLAGLGDLTRPLTAEGFDVYAYDQLGAGRSSRLADPRGYGLDRDVADLEEVRRTLGAERLVLVGHSYGATLAAHYLAAHPDRVADLVLLSPGSLDPADHSGDAATAGVPTGRRVAAYATALQPRALLGYALLQVDPAAAHAYLGDAEADARNDTLLRLTEAGLHCRPTQAPPATPGSGFYALQYPQSLTAPPPADVRPRLAGDPTPVLVLKGRCDYLSWRSAVSYELTFPNTTLLYLGDSGHNVYQDQPDLVRAAVAAFVVGGPLPQAPYAGQQEPADYQG